jgi:hypothetical protein
VVPRPAAGPARRARSTSAGPLGAVARRGVRLGPHARRARALRARVGGRPQPRGRYRRSAPRPRRRSCRARGGASLRRRDVRRRHLPGRRRAHAGRPRHARRAVARDPTRGSAARDGPGLPGAVVLARRGEPALPPLRQPIAARRRRFRRLGDRGRHPLQQPAPRPRRGSPRRAHSDLDLTPSVLNGVLELPLRLESRLVAAGMRLPAGLSLLAVLRRPSLRRLPALRRPAAPQAVRAEAVAA